MFPVLTWFSSPLLLCLFWSLDGEQVQTRMNLDAQQNRPLVAHIMVALCDNRYQGIVPVASALGNGQDPRSNLYWGALYGIRTHLTKKAGWRLRASSKGVEEHLLERIILQRTLQRAGKSIETFIVAEAWDGQFIDKTLKRFADAAAGSLPLNLSLSQADTTTEIPAGSAAHLLIFVGHNGLMDLDLDLFSKPAKPARPALSTAVFACRSKDYFLAGLNGLETHPLILTKTLMAPEAYAVEASITAWFSGKTPTQTKLATASAYARYQRCSVKQALTVFSSEP